MGSDSVSNRPIPGSSRTAKAKDLWKWWRANLIDPPPPIVKQRIVKRYGKQYKANTLFETGTFQGDMLAANRRVYAHLISVELGQTLHNNAVRRFVGQPNIRLVNGDSADVLRETTAHLVPPIVFWLDAHYSGPGTHKGAQATPVVEELEAISHSPGVWVTLIDDARLFDGSEGFPKLEDLMAAIRLTHPSHRIRIWHDVIRVEPVLL